MSLHIYMAEEEIPANVRYVACNDSYFNGYTTLCNSPLEQDILKTIDKAVYNSPVTFTGRTQGYGALNKIMLSTGTKTLLNILQHPDKYCFNLAECGNNALCFLPQITRGHVLWKHPILVYTGTKTCDIEFRGKHYTDIYEFLNYVYHEILRKKVIL